jgi:hypothetical protein
MKPTLSLAFFLLFFTTNTLFANLTITLQKCNFKVNPFGVETPNPAFSWQLSSTLRNQKQTAYRIIVSNTEGGKNDVKNITEKGKKEIFEVKNTEGGRLAVQLGSGQYQFIIKTVKNDK